MAEAQAENGPVDCGSNNPVLANAPVPITKALLVSMSQKSGKR